MLELWRSATFQASLWALVGMLGIAFFAGGIIIASRSGDDDDRPSATSSAAVARPGGSPTPGAPGATPTPSATQPTATLSPTVSPTAPGSATPAPTAVVPPTSTPSPRPTATPAEAATPTPISPTSTPSSTPTPAAARVYCATSAFPVRMVGLLTFKGADAPAGTMVTLLFDGITGPSAPTPQKGGYAVEFTLANDACANRVGSAISVVVAGQVFSTGLIAGTTDALARFDIAVP